MTDDQWLKAWRKWCSWAPAIRVRWLHKQIKQQQQQALPF